MTKLIFSSPGASQKLKQAVVPNKHIVIFKPQVPDIKIKINGFLSALLQKRGLQYHIIASFDRYGTKREQIENYLFFSVLGNKYFLPKHNRFT